MNKLSKVTAKYNPNLSGDNTKSPADGDTFKLVQDGQGNTFGDGHQ